MPAGFRSVSFLVSMPAASATTLDGIARQRYSWDADDATGELNGAETALRTLEDAACPVDGGASSARSRHPVGNVAPLCTFLMRNAADALPLQGKENGSTVASDGIPQKRFSASVSKLSRHIQGSFLALREADSLVGAAVAGLRRNAGRVGRGISARERRAPATPHTRPTHARVHNRHRRLVPPHPTVCHRGTTTPASARRSPTCPCGARERLAGRSRAGTAASSRHLRRRPGMQCKLPALAASKTPTH